MAEELKNAKAHEKQAEARAKKAVEEVEVTVRGGHFDGLTKRNEDYLFRLGKALDEKDYDQEKKNQVLDEMYRELKEKQRQGIVATKLYGTVTERCDMIVNGKKDDAAKSATEIPSFWTLALDNGLIMLIMFCILYALMGAFSKSQASVNGGWLTLIATSVIAGCGLAFFYRMMAKNSQNDDKKKRTRRSIAITLELIAIWMIAFGLIAFIPASINRTMSPIAYAAIGVVAFAVRYYLKGKLNFKRVTF
ncbi:Uncharacterized membrane-anchored protein [Ligilactobacillus sp. WC1T17]|uniref:Uncharacterized membrane-anchored protein n=1 Tax=Ligilactobacillus ruminis TaxID=1623 RepID=A0ABY1ACI5_9LACO|nr:Uncharacterized membrane-anchored protein [Ligilactobacillus ruminis]